MSKGIKSIGSSIGRAVKGVINFAVDSVQFVFTEVLAPIFKPIFAIIGIESEDIYTTEVMTTQLINQEAVYIKTAILNAIYFASKFNGDQNLFFRSMDY